MSRTSTFTSWPVASTWSRPPKPMSYAQPSPPTSHTERGTSASAASARSAPPSMATRQFAELARRRGGAVSMASSSPDRHGLVSSATSSAGKLGGESLRGAPGRVGRGCRHRGAARGRTRRCPRTASCSTPGRARRAGRVRRGGQVAAVDRRAAGRVGDQEAVAEELGEQPDVGRLAAAGAGARRTRTAVAAAPRPERVRGMRDARDVGDLLGRTSNASRSATRCSSAGRMLIALRRGWVRSLAGQTSTQSPQPVQSSGATCTVKDRPSSSGVYPSGTDRKRRRARRRRRRVRTPW